MQVKLERLKKDFNTVWAFNRTPGKGYTRFSYSEEDRMAREYLKGQFEALGLTTKLDGVGNIRARLEGQNPQSPIVMVGSHIDTVLHGGKFDGLLGSLAALEVLRVLKENGFVHTHPIELVIFSEEEGSNFGATTTGSKFFVGRSNLSAMHELKTPAGVSMYDMVKAFGLQPDMMEGQALKPGEVKVMLELHIEQSVVLEQSGISIGIVEAIAGMKAFEIVFEGVPNHAGATPMNLRNDALLAAAQVVTAVEKLARESPYPHTVGTVGRLICEPNVSNIIPGRVSLRLDTRDVSDEGMDYMAESVRKEVEEAAKFRGLRQSMRLLGESRAILLPKEVTDCLALCAESSGLPYKRMNSGAVHDCCLLADIAPIGLIFVPSIGGRSHVPEEDTLYEDIEKGANLLLSAVMKFSR